jgi:hypothetical protein
MEIEVNNRSISHMRTDLFRYFDDQALVSVVGIKFFGTKRCPVQRAAAVQWLRTGEGGLVVTAIRDFGIEPMDRSATVWFAREMLNALPGVPAEDWTNNRYAPVAANPPSDLDTAMDWIIDQNSHVPLYGGAHPTLVFRGADLTAAFHNLPPEERKNPFQDLVLNLADVLYWTARGADL